MAWEIEFTDEFGSWWQSLDEAEQDSAAHVMRMLEEQGTGLLFPHTSKIYGSRHSAMRELRIQHHGQPYRVLYIFDSRRVAILLVGGQKTGDTRWYEKNIPLADRIYDELLEELANDKE